MMVSMISLAALAQARYALFEKAIKCEQSLALAREVYPDDSANVVFWSHEVQRVQAALYEFGQP